MDRQECYLIMQSASDWIGYKLQLTAKEYDLMKSECTNYNDWYITVLNGLAPVSSYTDRYERDRLINQYNKYRSVLGEHTGRRKTFNDEVDYLYQMYSPYYDEWTISDSIYTEDDGTVTTVRMVSYPVRLDDGTIEEYEDEYSNIIPDSIAWQPNANEIITSIINKYDSYNLFAIGYSLLPMTASLVEDNRLKVSDALYDHLKSIDNI